MEGDSFIDPRRRSTRGRGRGSKGSRTRGKPGSSCARRVPGQPGLSSPGGEELGSNAYRFREEQIEEEDFDTDVDFEQAAAASMYDDPNAVAVEDDLGLRFMVNLSGMEHALETVPLWARLGDVSRFSLGIKDDDVIEKYLDGFANINTDVSNKSLVGEALADELAKLGFEDGDGDESEEVINKSIQSLEQQT